MIAAIYMLLYLACGVFVVRMLLPRQSVLTRIWLGLSGGLLMMMWLPALCAMAMRFTAAAHYVALVPLALISAGSWLLRDKREARGWDARETTLLRQCALVVLPLTVLGGYLQYTHCLRPDEWGGLSVGQSTYGDLPMHLSFISSLPNNAFPPDYPFFPGTQLSYPFLTDSLSSSLLLLGFSLPMSVVIPGTLMMALCYLGVMVLARDMTTGKKTVVLAMLLFFLNGGLGFLYDFDLAGGAEWDGTLTLWGRIQNILTGYYTTPTNQPTPNNLRWSNVIADLMIPQRTLLGGWCMVLPCFMLLWSCFDKSRRQEQGGVRPLVLLGIWGGALPLIHTHSFLALGLCSLGFMVHDLVHDEERAELLKRYLLYGVIAVVLAAPQLFLFTFRQAFSGEAGNGFLSLHFNWVNNEGNRDVQGDLLLWLRFMLPGLMLLLPFAWQRTGRFPRLGRYLRYLGGAALAVHLFCLVNRACDLKDFYLWFYVKNIGLPFIALLLALFERDERNRRLFAGALPIILAAELVRFQPNIYDNNKLLYLAWLLCCMIVANWLRSMWHRMKGLRARPAMAVAFCVITFLSAGLTLWREAVSDYQAFSQNAQEVGWWARDNTEDDAVFLTGTQHLNPVSSLAGRTTVCGPDLWLYYHGIDTTQRKQDIRDFFTDPAAHTDVLETYGVDYIMVSSYERSEYDVDTQTLQEMYQVVFTNWEATIYRVSGED